MYLSAAAAAHMDIWGTMMQDALADLMSWKTLNSFKSTVKNGFSLTTLEFVYLLLCRFVYGPV